MYITLPEFSLILYTCSTSVHIFKCQLHTLVLTTFTMVRNKGIEGGKKREGKKGGKWPTVLDKTKQKI